MDALTWVGRPRKFTRQLERPRYRDGAYREDEKEVYTQNIESRLRSDGTMFYIASDPNGYEGRWFSEEAIEKYKENKKINTEKQWEKFLTDEVTSDLEPVTEDFFREHVPIGFTEVQ